MQFTKLRITGFKSFVEPVEFPIEPGLTGIVGPNGCGKSNVVEALRWTMGENSAKRLRGSEMDDVIFSGSAGRPARNIAEVALVLDNRERTALAEFNAEDEIEVTRHIERGMGSDYRINARPVRQKDVQLLFADQATGAHSTSIVSQGRIGALISAKPEERRQVLEEAAGVSGLHARRHEAELKLKAAEANLARVADQVQLMDQQLRALKTQVRQTSRYRNLGELIRKAEAGLLFLKNRATESALRSAEAAFAAAEAQVREITSRVAKASTAAAESAAKLPPLRQEEAAASAVVQRLFLERETLEREAKRINEAQAALRQRLEEVKSDSAREENLGKEAATALAALASEKEQAEKKLKELEVSGPGLEARTTTARASCEAQEKIFAEKTREFAEISARTAAIRREIEGLGARRSTLAGKLADIQKQADEAQDQAKTVDPGFTQTLVTSAENTLSQKQNALQQAQESRRNAEENLSAARAARDAAQAEKIKIETEIEALKAVLQGGSEGAPVADKLTIEKDYEVALAAALGEGLLASLDSSSKSFWHDLGNIGFLGAPGLPRGAQPLLPHIEAPAALKRALSHVGIVASDEEGERLSRELKPGQVLVSREGALWRWDGYTQRKEAKTQAAQRLQQRARLTEAEAALQALQPRLDSVEESFRKAEMGAQAALTQVQECEVAVQQAFEAVNGARQKHAETLSRKNEAEARLATLGENLAGLREDESFVVEAIAALEEEQRALPKIEKLQESLEATRQILSDQRGKLIEAEAAQASYQASLNLAETQLKTVQESMRSWQSRAETGARHIEALAQRRKSLEGEAAELAARPKEIEAERQRLLTKSSVAEETRKAAADALLAAEQRQSELEKQLRAAEEALMEAKESRVRHEEQMYRARSAHDEIAMRIREHWHCAPEELPVKAGLPKGEEELNLAQLEHDLARFTRERENMGPVNLRAELEAEEIEAQIDKISADKSDLEGAIAKLRQGISTLNREARERLENAFTEVNKNFSSLFERLFGGGKAHLKLIESEDPLEAGLEIYASPPGKRLQVLSLLSGGEQALTAIALLFAIFLVNPSPICVLDEVDAPLDEANVDRFCTLVREMAEGGKTRFLVVTHHRLTMARMDRLFGVTMAEKGVSQLVSVDLKEALAMREQGGEQPGPYGDVRAAE